MRGRTRRRETPASPDASALLDSAALRLEEVVGAAHLAVEEIQLNADLLHAAPQQEANARDRLAADLARTLIDRIEGLRAEAWELCQVVERAMSCLPESRRGGQSSHAERTGRFAARPQDAAIAGGVPNEGSANEVPEGASR